MIDTLTKGEIMTQEQQILLFEEETGDVIEVESGLTVAAFIDEGRTDYVANTNWDKTVRYARLFAAAPQLLDALKTALHYISEDAPAPAVYEIEAAIAKAEKGV